MNKETGMKKYWDTILLWSGYDHYLKIKEIAKTQGITIGTVNRRIAWFKSKYPEQHEKIKADRAAIRSASCNMDKQLEQMSKGNYTPYDESMDSFIKERF